MAEDYLPDPSLSVAHQLEEAIERLRVMAKTVAEANHRAITAEEKFEVLFT